MPFVPFVVQIEPLPEREVTRFWKEERRTIVLLTVAVLLEGNFARKLA